MVSGQFSLAIKHMMAYYDIVQRGYEVRESGGLIVSHEMQGHWLFVSMWGKRCHLSSWLGLGLCACGSVGSGWPHYRG